jgi:hypothetical protein
MVTRAPTTTTAPSRERGDGDPPARGQPLPRVRHCWVVVDWEAVSGSPCTVTEETELPAEAAGAMPEEDAPELAASYGLAESMT